MAKIYQEAYDPKNITCRIYAKEAIELYEDSGRIILLRDVPKALRIPDHTNGVSERDYLPIKEAFDFIKSNPQILHF